MNDTKAAQEARRRNGCNGCDRRWSGMNMAHCSVCHHTFGGVGSFDKHRSGSKPGTKTGIRRAGECTPPADIGLTQNEHGTWVAPSNGVDFAEIHGRTA